MRVRVCVCVWVIGVCQRARTQGCEGRLREAHADPSASFSLRSSSAANANEIHSDPSHITYTHNTNITHNSDSQREKEKERGKGD